MMLPAVEQAMQAWESAAASHGLALDMAACGSINCVADSVAQYVEDNGANVMARTARFGVFGFLDGAVAHGWFEWIDSVVGDSGTLSETALKVLGDAAVYTPLWCIWFLVAFALLERKDPVAEVR